MTAASTRVEERYDHYGPLKSMVRRHGYVMCRRPGARPFVLSEKDWNKLSLAPDAVGNPDAPRAMKGHVVVHKIEEESL